MRTSNELSAANTHWRNIAARFLPPGSTVIQTAPARGGFSDAIVIDLQSTTGRFALRGWPANNWPLARVAERHRWLRHLHQAGIPVAVPLIMPKTLETILQIDDFAWQLEPWLPGIAATSQKMTPARWQSLMSGLARMHISSAGYHPMPAGAGWFSSSYGPSPAIAERQHIIAGWTPRKLMQARDQLSQQANAFTTLANEILAGFLRHSQRIAIELTRFESVSVSLFPCFRDLWSEHVLFSGDAVTGFIDPTAARMEHVSSDLSRLLASLLGDDLPGWQAALRDYEAVRPLTESDHQLIRLLDRSSVLLSGMTWIERWCADEITPEQLDSIRHRLQKLSVRLRALS